MKNKSKKIEIEDLVNLINKYSYEYYSLGAPTISDSEWDKLYDRLVQLEEETGIVLKNSPTRKVGYEIVKGFNKHSHEYKLYSLNKCNNLKDLESWYNDIKKISYQSEFSIEYKYDGLTISLTYEDGYLQKAATRGDGLIGEDVTAQVKVIKTVPLNIPFKNKLIVHGEGIMKISNLTEYNKTAKEPLKNARNAVAGAIRNLDTSITAKRKIDFIAFSVVYSEGLDIATQAREYDFLKNNNFYISKDFRLFSDFNEISREIREIDKIKNSIDFLIDGVVIKVNNKNTREKLGYTEKFPRWAIAYKFKSHETTTNLIDIKWQVGRSGKITPIAILSPVEIAGATVKRATLNNCNDIQRKKIMLNSRVFVRRSNEVIPEVLGVASYSKDSKEVNIPRLCPSCDSVLKTEGANLFCKNIYGCNEQIKQKISHYASRDAINIAGISDKTIDLFIKELGINSVIDLYKIKYEDLLGLEGFKEKKINNIIKSINSRKEIKLDKFIYSLGINGIGAKASRQLAEKFNTIDSIINANKDDIESIYEFGEIMAENIVSFFSDSNNKQFIKEILEILNVKNYKCDTINILSDKNIAITGTVDGISRGQIKEEIESLGGKIQSSISKSTKILIVGTNPGSKLKNAEKLGITILTYDEYKEYIKDKSKERFNEDN